MITTLLSEEQLEGSKILFASGSISIEPAGLEASTAGKLEDKFTLVRYKRPSRRFMHLPHRRLLAADGF